MNGFRLTNCVAFSCRLYCLLQWLYCSETWKVVATFEGVGAKPNALRNAGACHCIASLFIAYLLTPYLKTPSLVATVKRLPACTCSCMQLPCCVICFLFSSFFLYFFFVIFFLYFFEIFFSVFFSLFFSVFFQFFQCFFGFFSMFFQFFSPTCFSVLISSSRALVTARQAHTVNCAQ